MRYRSRIVLLWAIVLCGLVVSGAEAEVGERQVTGLSARHQMGQTLLSWKEIDPLVKQDSIPFRELRTLPRDLDQLILLINQLRRNDRVFIVATREDAGALVSGARLPNLPPSAATL